MNRKFLQDAAIELPGLEGRALNPREAPYVGQAEDQPSPCDPSEGVRVRQKQKPPVKERRASPQRELSAQKQVSHCPEGQKPGAPLSNAAEAEAAGGLGSYTQSWSHGPHPAATQHLIPENGFLLTIVNI